MRLLLLLASFCVACGDDSTVELGIVEFLQPNTAMIEMPDTATVGQPFTIKVITYANLCTHYERTDFELDADVAEVSPYNRTETCKPLKLCYIPHEALVQFDSAGTKTVRVIGLRDLGHDHEEVIEILRPITVE